jgi:putative hemolysin
MMIEILIILVLILLNGIFAMSEIAIVSSKKSKLESMAKKGDLGAKTALNISANPTRFLAAIQAGITFIGIFTGVFSGAKLADSLAMHLQSSTVLAPYAKTIAFLIIVIPITLLTLIFGELIPKRIGIHKPENIGRLMAPFMNLVAKAFHPLVWLLTVVTDSILMLFNIKNEPTESIVTEEEVKDLIAQGTSSGTFDEVEQDIVERVFNLGDRTVGSLMTNRIEVEWLDVNDSDEENLNKVIQSNHSDFLVCEDGIDEVIGVLNAKKYLAAISTSNFYGIKTLLETPIFMPENMTAFKALETFKGSKAKIGVVLDEFGAVQGIVTMYDLFEALIIDHDEPDSQNEVSIVKREDGSWLIDALLPFEEFLQYFEIEDVSAEDKTGFHSLGGFILHLNKSIPRVGEKFEWRNYIFEVVDMDGNRIDKVLVTQQELEEEE